MPSEMGALPISTQSGDCMSLYLDGLKAAQEIVTKQGIEKLADFISDIEANLIETTSVKFEVETR